MLGKVLALAMLLGSVPLTIGVIVVPHHHQPELTLNICHPLHAFAPFSNTLIALPVAPQHKPALRDQGETAAATKAAMLEPHLAPDTPPPEPAG